MPNTVPEREDWRVEITDQQTRSGIVLFEYAVREVGKEVFLLNNHRSQFRETHQRIQRVGRDFLHVSGAEVAPLDVDNFVATDPRAYRWVDKAPNGDWRDDGGRTLAPYIFATAPWAGGRDEELDPQWEREQYTKPIQGQVDAAIERYLDRAEANNYVGDKRGTTLDLQVGAGVDDGARWESGPTYQNNSFAVQVGLFGANFITQGFHRFTLVSIPKDATINSCVVTFTSSQTRSDDILTKLHFEAADDPAAVANAADFIARALTSGTDWDESIDWVTNSEFPSDDFKAELQEVVNRVGWVANNAAQFFHMDDGSATDDWQASWAYDADTGLALQLAVDYTTGKTEPFVINETDVIRVPDKVAGY